MSRIRQLQISVTSKILYFSYYGTILGLLKSFSLSLLFLIFLSLFIYFCFCFCFFFLWRKRERETSLERETIAARDTSAEKDFLVIIYYSCNLETVGINALLLCTTVLAGVYQVMFVYLATISYTMNEQAVRATFGDD